MNYNSIANITHQGPHLHYLILWHWQATTSQLDVITHPCPLSNGGTQF